MSAVENFLDKFTSQYRSDACNIKMSAITATIALTPLNKVECTYYKQITYYEQYRIAFLLLASKYIKVCHRWFIPFFTRWGYILITNETS